MTRSEKIQQLHPQIRTLFEAFLEECEKHRRVKLRVLETYRPQERQDKLYRIGRDLEAGVWVKTGKTVTNAHSRQSYHFWRVAMDVAPEEVLSLPNWAPSHGHWAIMKSAAERFGLQNPWEWDRPHFQYTEGHKWREWMQLFPTGKLPINYFQAMTRVVAEDNPPV